MTSGPNQHYVPRFVQRAFGIRPRKREIWRFGLAQVPERRLIKRTGSADSFYSRPSADGRSSLDDAITSVETKLSRMLYEIRSGSPGDHINSEAAAAIVSHLAARTAHVRSTFGDALAHLLKKAKTFFKEPDSVKMMMGLDCDIPTDRFRDLLINELNRTPEITELGIPTRVLERAAFFYLKENPDEILGQSSDFVSAMIDSIRPQSGALVRDSHNKALDQILVTSEYENLLQKLEWTIEKAPISGAILPDCVVIAVREDGDANAHLFVARERLQAVVMAVSPNKLLVGRKIGFEMPDDFDYNIAAARSSHSFFLTPRNDTETSRLHALIGKRLRPSLEKSIEEAFGSVLNGNADEQPSNARVPDRSIGWKPSSRIQYKLSLVNCGNESANNKIQARIKILVAQVAQFLQLERLDGITIGNDYPTLLRTVDRGIRNAPPVETVSPEIGIGIAQAITVMRSGVAKGHIVLSSTVSQALISNEQDDVDWATHVLVKELALVALIGIVDEALPGFWLAPVESEINGWLYGNVHAALDGYAASWIAARFGDGKELTNGLRELLVDSIDRLMTVVPEERLAYYKHRNLDKLLDVAMPAIRHVLRFAANLLGHCSFIGDSPFDESGVLKDALERAGLTAWFNWYQEHLEHFHHRLGRWESFEEFLDFNIHVERLLWAVGMFPWEGPEGLRIEIPLNTDTNALLARVGKP